MQLENHIRAIQSDLEAAAALGDETAAEVGRRLSEVLDSSLHLRLLDLLQEAALGLSETLPSGSVEVRLAGRDPELVFVPDASVEAEPAPGDDLSARITLRLPEELKGRVEDAAAREGISTNAWVVRTLAREVEPLRLRRVQTGNRLQGFTRS